MIGEVILGRWNQGCSWINLFPYACRMTIYIGLSVLSFFSAAPILSVHLSEQCADAQCFIPV